MLIVEPAWLEERLGEDSAVRVIDASWYLPAMKRDFDVTWNLIHAALPGIVAHVRSELARRPRPDGRHPGSDQPNAQQPVRSIS